MNQICNVHREVRCSQCTLPLLLQMTYDTSCVRLALQTSTGIHYTSTTKLSPLHHHGSESPHGFQESPELRALPRGSQVLTTSVPQMLASGQDIFSKLPGVLHGKHNKKCSSEAGPSCHTRRTECSDGPARVYPQGESRDDGHHCSAGIDNHQSALVVNHN